MKTIGVTHLGGAPAPKNTRGNELAVSFVGAGGAFSPIVGKGETNLVLVHRGTRIAIDCGRQWPEVIGSSLGLSRNEIDAFVISHCHADHVGGLGTVAQMTRYLDQRRPGLVVTDALEGQLWDETLSGGLGHDNAPGDCLGTYFEVSRARALDERTCAVRVGELDLELFRTLHAPGNVPSWRDAMVSYGVYVPAFGVWISMDTCFDPELVARYAERGAEWFFHDASRKSSVHASVEELATLPETVKRSMTFQHTPEDFGTGDAGGFGDRFGFPGLASRGDTFLFTFVGSV